ncbi:four-helix bundle copper-binding protein [Achromobacter aloeverae]|uniref:Four-helix bundle copper-binding protein n=1 Tax=Achromobacter aloeverae TaxID=1750518 RepID=A0A4Q1HCM1_9BURK|nr:four-helix bundle copper-binding protein [Achromobacter aloeverae]RXN83327.1 four-helix bundle copper-binding protein [Achromobacter aloeverae]
MTDRRFGECIRACYACAEACDRCAAACLAEGHAAEMARCVALDIECGASCRYAAGVMARGTEYAERACALCAEVCNACGAECGRHAEDHCKQCAQACRACAALCSAMAAV